MEKRPKLPKSDLIDKVIDDNSTVGEPPLLKVYIEEWRGQEPSHAFKDPLTGARLYYVSRTPPELLRRAAEVLAESSDVPYMSVGDRVEYLKSIGDILEDNAGDLSKLIALATGKPLKEAEAEVEDSVSLLEDSASIYDLYSKDLGWRGDGAYRWPWTRKPMLILPASTAPLFTAIHGLVHSIMLGMPAIVKPPQSAGIVASIAVSAAEETGLGRSVALVTGHGSMVLDRLVNENLIGGVAYAGSSITVSSILSKASILPHAGLCADNSLAVVCSGANTTIAARSIVEARVQAAGRGCLATRAVIVEASIADSLVEALIEHASKLRPGDPREASSTLGPMNGMRRIAHMESMIEDAVKRGAQLLYGGRVKRTLYRPAILDQVSKSSRVLWEKSNVPLIPVVRVSSCPEAIAFSKILPYVDALLIYGEPWTRIADEAARSGFRIVYVNRDLERPRVFEECHRIPDSPLLSYTPGRRLVSRIIYNTLPLGDLEAEPYR